MVTCNNCGGFWNWNLHKMKINYLQRMGRPRRICLTWKHQNIFFSYSLVCYISLTSVQWDYHKSRKCLFIYACNEIRHCVIQWARDVNSRNNIHVDTHSHQPKAKFFPRKAHDNHIYLLCYSFLYLSKFGCCLFLFLCVVSGLCIQVIWASHSQFDAVLRIRLCCTKHWHHRNAGYYGTGKSSTNTCAGSLHC